MEEIGMYVRDEPLRDYTIVDTASNKCRAYHRGTQRLVEIERISLLKV